MGAGSSGSMKAPSTTVVHVSPVHGRVVDAEGSAGRYTVRYESGWGAKGATLVDEVVYEEAPVHNSKPKPTSSTTSQSLSVKAGEEFEQADTMEELLQSYIRTGKKGGVGSKLEMKVPSSPGKKTPFEDDFTSPTGHITHVQRAGQVHKKHERIGNHGANVLQSVPALARGTAPFPRLNDF